MLIRVVLPAPFGPEQAEELARFDLEADVVDGALSPGLPWASLLS